MCTKTWKFVKISFKHHYLYSNRFTNLYNVITEMSGLKDSSGFRNLLTLLTKSMVLEHVLLCMQNYVDHYSTIVKHNEHYSMIKNFVMRLTTVSREEALIDCTQLHERMQSLGRDLHTIDFECQIRKHIDAIGSCIFPAVNNIYVTIQTTIQKLGEKLKDALIMYNLKDLTMQCQKCKRGYIYHQHKDCGHKLCAKCGFQSLLKIKYCVMCKKLQKIRNREIDDIDHSDSESVYSGSSPIQNRDNYDDDDDDVASEHSDRHDNENNDDHSNTRSEHYENSNDCENDDDDGRRSNDCSNDRRYDDECDDDDENDNHGNEMLDDECEVGSSEEDDDDDDNNDDDETHDFAKSPCSSYSRNSHRDSRSCSPDKIRRPKKRVKRIESNSSSSKIMPPPPPPCDGKKGGEDDNEESDHESIEKIMKHIHNVEIEKMNKNLALKRINNMISKLNSPASSPSQKSNDSSATRLPDDMEHINDNANDLPETALPKTPVIFDEEETARAIRMSLNFDETLEDIISKSNEPSPVVDNDDILHMFDELSGNSNSNQEQNLNQEQNINNVQEQQVNINNVQEQSIDVQDQEQNINNVNVQEQQVNINNVQEQNINGQESNNSEHQEQYTDRNIEDCNAVNALVEYLQQDDFHEHAQLKPKPICDLLETKPPVIVKIEGTKPIVKIEPTGMFDEPIEYYQYEQQDDVIIKLEKENLVYNNIPYEPVQINDNDEDSDDVMIVSSDSNAFKPKICPVKITRFSRVITDETTDEPPSKRIKIEKNKD